MAMVKGLAAGLATLAFIITVMGVVNRLLDSIALALTALIVVGVGASVYRRSRGGLPDA